MRKGGKGTSLIKGEKGLVPKEGKGDKGHLGKFLIRVEGYGCINNVGLFSYLFPF